MLKCKDLEILDYVQQYGGITIEQCSRLFYNTVYGYDTAKRKLRNLSQEGYLKFKRNFMVNKLVYYKKKELSYHSLVLMDLYTTLIAKGAEVLFFQREFKVPGAIADGFMIYKFNNVARMVLIEVELQKKCKLDKYNECYSRGLFHEKYGTFPLVLIISKEKRRIPKDTFKYQIINLDLELQDINSIL